MYKAAGVGVDLCSVSRTRQAMQKAHFTERIYTQAERAYLDAAGAGRAQSAAAMYAAKEAVAKALGTGFAEGVAPWLIEVTHEESGAPGVRLHGAAQERLISIGGGQVRLSLSHEGELAIAFAVIDRCKGSCEGGRQR